LDRHELGAQRNCRNCTGCQTIAETFLETTWPRSLTGPSETTTLSASCALLVALQRTTVNTRSKVHQRTEVKIHQLEGATG
jgi:hypothetical protein